MNWLTRKRTVVCMDVLVLAVAGSVAPLAQESLPVSSTGAGSAAATRAP